MSVATAMRKISSREFADWMAYDRIEPFGEMRADLRSGIIAAAVVNVNRGRGQKPFPASDFMPKFDEPERKVMTAAQIEARLMGFAAQHNASLK